MHECSKAVAVTAKQLPRDEFLTDLADLYKLFGDFTRLKILYCLSEEELCVQDIACVLGAGQSAISHQLRILKDNHLVISRKEGKMRLYSLADDHVRAILNMGYEHLCEEEDV